VLAAVTCKDVAITARLADKQIRRKLCEFRSTYIARKMFRQRYRRKSRRCFGPSLSVSVIFSHGWNYIFLATRVFTQAWIPIAVV
jgi:hypothetical protein